MLPLDPGRADSSTDRGLWSGWLDRELLGNSVSSWAVAAGIFVATVLVLSIVRAVVVRRARRLEEKKRRPLTRILLEIVSSLSWLTVLAVGLRVGVLPVTLGGRAEDVVRWIVVLAVAWQAALWASRVVEILLEVFVAHRLSSEHPEGEPAVASMGVFRFLAKLVVYTVVVLVALENLGIDVTALVTGLGVGGIAVALAVQNIVGDLFSSMSITLDKPFVVGDFIIVGDQRGTVEKIGIKTTRVRSLGGEQLVFGNSDLLSSRISNYKRMQERRIVFSLGVVYRTTADQVAAVPGILREAIEAQEQARFDRAHFRGFGAYSLDFEAVYYVLGADYALYMDVQQAINLEIMRRFEAEGIEFAYPTQTLFLDRVSSSEQGRGERPSRERAERRSTAQG